MEIALFLEPVFVVNEAEWMSFFQNPFHSSAVMASDLACWEMQ